TLRAPRYQRGQGFDRGAEDDVAHVGSGGESSRTRDPAGSLTLTAQLRRFLRTQYTSQDLTCILSPQPIAARTPASDSTRSRAAFAAVIVVSVSRPASGSSASRCARPAAASSA